MQTEEIWKNFRTELLGFILSRVKDAQLAEDILQDVFVKIHLNLNDLKSEDKLTSWLYQITRNSITDYFRKTKPSVEVIDLPEEISDTSDSKSFEKCMLRFVNELPEKSREALVQTELGNLSQKEYAEKLGISYSGTKSRVQRAKEELKELFVSCCAKEIPGSNGKLEFKDPEDCTC